jgi:hypothetical protein
MQSFNSQCKHSMAQQVGFVPSYWLAIDTVNLSNDRLPEIRVQEDTV